MQCKVGKYRKIVMIDAVAPMQIKRRLLELGFTAGQLVKIAKKSILGETYLLEIKGYYISMRKSLTEFVWVE